MQGSSSSSMDHDKGDDNMKCNTDKECCVQYLVVYQCIVAEASVTAFYLDGSQFSGSQVSSACFSYRRLARRVYHVLIQSFSAIFVLAFTLLACLQIFL